MLQKIGNFIKPPPKPPVCIILHYLSLTVMILGALLYIFISFDTINWILKFPHGNKLQLPLLLMHTSVRFLTLWLPFAIILIRWHEQKLSVAIIYISGCVICLLLSILSTVLIDDYKKAGLLKNEYVKLISEKVKTSPDFPSQVFLTLASDECCGWSGPIDFGPPEVIDISSKVDTNLEFMKKVAKCYGDTFSVEGGGPGGTLIYKPHPGSLPDGCDMMYKRLVRRICTGIAWGGIVVDIFAVAFITLYVMICCCAPKAVQVAPSSPEAEEEDPYSEFNETGGMNRPRFSLPPDPTTDGGGYIHVLPPPPSDYTFQMAQANAKHARKSHNNPNQNPLLGNTK